MEALPTLILTQIKLYSTCLLMEIKKYLFFNSDFCKNFGNFNVNFYSKCGISQKWRNYGVLGCYFLENGKEHNII